MPDAKIPSLSPAGVVDGYRTSKGPAAVLPIAPATALSAKPPTALLPTVPAAAIDGIIGGADADEIAMRVRLQNRMRKMGTTHHLVAYVFANPSHAFAKQNIFSTLEYWHHRSGDFMTLVFPGLRPADEERFDFSEDTIKQFDQLALTRTIQDFERETAWQYTGRTCVVIMLAGVNEQAAAARLDFSAVLDFDLEGLIEKKILSDARVVFEDLIRWAKEYAADDALWTAKQNWKEPAIQQAVLSILTKWLPAGVKDLFNASVAFRVQDLRPES